MADDLDILISRYLDGTASSDEVARLDAVLTTDRVAAVELYRSAFLDALLRDALVAEQLPEVQPGDHWVAADAFPIPRAAEAPARPVALMPAQRRRIMDGRSTLWRGTWGWATGLAACLVVATLIGWRALRPAGTVPGRIAVQPAPMPHVVVAGNGVVVRGPDGTRVLSANEPIRANDQIQTGAGTSAALTYDDEKTRITLAPQTTVTLAAGAAKMVVLASGRVDCHVAKQAPGQQLVIMTPEAQVTVIGTRFDVTASGGWTRLQVSEGTVQVKRLGDGGTVHISGGEFVDIAGPSASQASWTSKPIGRDMGEFWSTNVRPAGINQ